jgi:hypothetical protein
MNTIVFQWIDQRYKRFELDFYSASSLKQQLVGRHAAPSQPVFAPTH